MQIDATHDPDLFPEVPSRVALTDWYLSTGA